jgi:hypothetical protein
MFIVENRLTGRLLYPVHLGKIKKVYSTKSEAESAVEKLKPLVDPRRVDVVELSHSALLWLENYYRETRPLN